jgi:hypothetical protein
MPTENRRVATYLPKELDDRFKAFIADRQLKGDSQALIVILSEFLGVSLPVAQKVDYSAFVTHEQLAELSSKVFELSATIENGRLPGKILNKLLGQFNQLEGRVVSLEMTASQLDAQEPTPVVDKPVPGQMHLLELAESSERQSELPIGESESSKGGSQSSSNGELQPMRGSALARRLNVSPQSIANNKSNWKDEPNRFIEWTRKKDPDRAAWEYRSEGRLFYPIA